jgi:hypothetical protein
VLLEIHAQSKSKFRINIMKYFVRFEVLKVASVKMAVFWVVVPCSLVEVTDV